MMFLELAWYWTLGSACAAVLIYCSSVVSGNAENIDRDLP